jgi:SulP family sulfate permease
MSGSNQGTTAPSWTREALAGTSGAMAVLPMVLTLGLLACAPLGAAAAQVGVLAAFVTAGVGALVHAALSRMQMPASGPSSATALTLASLVTHLVATAPAPLGLPAIVALCGLAVLLSGALQIVYALAGLSRLARMVPQPVLAGFMNSAALLIVISQVPLLLDLPLGSHPGLADLAQAHPASLALGLGTACFIWWLARRWPRLPAALLGMVAGTGVHALGVAWGGATSFGASIGALPSAWPWPTALLPLMQAGSLTWLQAHAGAVSVTAAALATIGALESSLNQRAMDQQLNTRHDTRRELIALGCGNIACGLLGGIPLSVTRARTLATLQAGGSGRLAGQVGAAAQGLAFVVGGPLLAAMPLPVLAGVMLTFATGLADRWSGRMLARWWAGDRSTDLTLGLGVVALVVGSTLWRGMAVGIGVGVLLSLVSFAARMNRSLLQGRYAASARPSRRIYPAPVEARLRPLREAITVFEVEGPLFFGSGDRLLDEADTLAPNCRCLVIDLRRVGAIDESGAVALQSLAMRAAQRGIQVALAGLADGSAPARALSSFALALPHWPDADRAVEAAEQHLLGGPDGGDLRAMAAVPLAESSLLAGLDDAQVAVVTARLLPRQLQPGELLFAEGEPGDRLFVVSRGSVSILSTPDPHGRTQRYLSVSPGMMIGETAMLDGHGRTAGAVADAPSEVHALTREALDELEHKHPDVAIQLHRNVALHLSQRLRDAAAAWRASTS